MGFFGRYYRVDTQSVETVSNELSSKVDDHWEEKYKTDEKRNNTGLTELAVKTTNMTVHFYTGGNRNINAYVTPTVTERSETASYGDFEESDYTLESYLTKYFEPISS